jgi:hypothetical protein
MGVTRQPSPAKLFTGLLAGDQGLFDEADRVLEETFGPIDLSSPVWPFTNTDYYRDELGETVWRRFVFFERLIDVTALPSIKRSTNEIEKGFCDRLGRPHDRRPINVDPGYMTAGKFVLATTKDHAHRLYIAEGIYAEITLRWQSGAWRSWPWTYADYAAPTYHEFLTQARVRLKNQLAARA